MRGILIGLTIAFLFWVSYSCVFSFSSNTFTKQLIKSICVSSSSAIFVLFAKYFFVLISNPVRLKLKNNIGESIHSISDWQELVKKNLWNNDLPLSRLSRNSAASIKSAMLIFHNLKFVSFLYLHTNFIYDFNFFSIYIEMLSRCWLCI